MIHTNFQSGPWAIHPDYLHGLGDRIAKAQGPEGRLGASLERGEGGNPVLERFGKTAVIGVHGILFKGIGEDASRYGYLCDTDLVRKAADELLEDDAVEGVFLWIESPGGLVAGVPEAAESLTRLRESKPVLAFSESICASGGYWLGACADALYSSTTALVGSVGVVSTYADATRLYNEGMGVKFNIIQSGKFKTAGDPKKEMSAAERAHLQEKVDRIADDFRAHVATRREGIDSKVLEEAGAYLAAHAPEGFVDGPNFPDFESFMREFL